MYHGGHGDLCRGRRRGSWLTSVEKAAAHLAVAAVNGDGPAMTQATVHLRSSGVPDWARRTLARAPGWPSIDNDRLDIVVSVATRMARSHSPVSDEDDEALRAVGLTEPEIVDFARLAQRRTRTIRRCRRP